MERVYIDIKKHDVQAMLYTSSEASTDRACYNHINEDDFCTLQIQYLNLHERAKNDIERDGFWIRILECCFLL